MKTIWHRMLLLALAASLAACGGDGGSDDNAPNEGSIQGEVTHAGATGGGLRIAVFEVASPGCPESEAPVRHLSDTLRSSAFLYGMEELADGSYWIFAAYDPDRSLGIRDCPTADDFCGDGGGELVIEGGNTVTANFDVDTPCL